MSKTLIIEETREFGEEPTPDDLTDILWACFFPAVASTVEKGLKAGRGKVRIVISAHLEECEP